MPRRRGDKFEIFIQIGGFVVAFLVALSPIAYKAWSNFPAEDWIDAFRKSDGVLIAIVFAADVLWRCLATRKKNNPARVALGLLAIPVLFVYSGLYIASVNAEMQEESSRQMQLEAYKTAWLTKQPPRIYVDRSYVDWAKEKHMLAINLIAMLASIGLEIAA